MQSPHGKASGPKIPPRTFLLWSTCANFGSELNCLLNWTDVFPGRSDPETRLLLVLLTFWCVTILRWSDGVFLSCRQWRKMSNAIGSIPGYPTVRKDDDGLNLEALTFQINLTLPDICSCQFPCGIRSDCNSVLRLACGLLGNTWQLEEVKRFDKYLRD